MRSLARRIQKRLELLGSGLGLLRSAPQAAFRLLRCPKKLTIIPGATHLFEEPGTLEAVVYLAHDDISTVIAPDFDSFLREWAACVFHLIDLPLNYHIFRMVNYRLDQELQELLIG